MSDVGVILKSDISTKTNPGNNVEEMELDDFERAAAKNHHDDEDAEEGEISDSKEADDDDNQFDGTSLSPMNILTDQQGHYENRAGGFITGVDIFGKEEQGKLEERAKRFGLDQDARLPTECQLKELYDSLNMKLGDGLDKSYRMNALHMRGTENLSTQDVFAYFKDYAPSFIEWISDYACNVVWLDEQSAARALMGLSQPISGLEAYHAKANPFSEKSDAEDGDSVEDEDSKDASEAKEEVVMVVAEIEGEGGENDIMVVDEQKENIAVTHKSAKAAGNKTNAVKASAIKIPIPPGRWRKGVDHPKAQCILLRFSTRSDKKFQHNEKLSEYYKKHGNPNYGGMKGIITASRKRRYQRVSEFPAKVFDDDVGDERDFADSAGDDSKNPWGGLAQSWNRLDKTRGKQPEAYGEERLSPPTFLPSAGRRDGSSRPVFERLGAAAPRPARASGSEGSASPPSSDDDGRWTRRSKAPRMRMYADEEEDRLQQQRRRLAGPSVWSRLRPAEEPRPDGSSSAGSDSDGASDSASASVGGSETPPPPEPKTGVADLRTKLDLKKSLRQPVSVRQKSPLRIEIDNDEYYRLIGSD
ncbi:nuclear cap-binding protein subunit 3-like [Bacillus rossius redtenbacheri]|uniref:nuclear cap-binding protein subunit 3-like n=1 Tax=Bacillus rossius redtenbacheri TaxID=93214 RepID=UPI002FDCEAD7